MTRYATLAMLVSLPLLAGCVVETTTTSTTTSTTSTPSKAEQACLRAVSRASGNGDVVVQSSSFSQAGTEVIVGVGAGEYGRAPWRCIAYSDGSTAGVEYIGGGEGAA